MLLALVLPLSSGVVTTLSARPGLLAVAVAAALLFTLAAWIGGSWATTFGLAGVLILVRHFKISLVERRAGSTGNKRHWLREHPCSIVIIA